ncbi:hypothetical protein NQT62_01605 [Limnobacter humi]|uniref:Alpha/beta hydrolase n=1 Tax=Limnobacter humi TaxID=1778671 RepID=A0ABT1WEG3_9BURK|nr:hypothetical protein [Limnobacter humi]MCQ8895132.1 hypothetical protein [Limnobacter humi]
MSTLVKPLVVMAHGWAYTPTFFEPWLHQLATEQPTLFAAMDWCLLDAGYSQQTSQNLRIGPVNIPCLSATALYPVLRQALRCVGIGHSMGLSTLLECASQAEKHWAHLVSLNGFTHFTARHTDQPGTPARVLERMLRRAHQNLPAVVDEFQIRSGCTQTAAWNDQALLHDLQRLMTLDSRPLLLRATDQGTTLTCLHNLDDAIVSAELTAQCFQPWAQAMTLPGAHSDMMQTPRRYTSSTSPLVITLTEAAQLAITKPHQNH